MHAVTDYKCAFFWVIVDLKDQDEEHVCICSTVQGNCSRTHIDYAPFDDKDLREPLEPELVKELEWQSDMADKTKKLYRF